MAKAGAFATVQLFPLSGRVPQAPGQRPTRPWRALAYVVLR